MSSRWHILREGDSLTLARHLPPRFDFAVRTALEAGDALCLAHQIRQDLWRALRILRGFSPVVRLSAGPTGWDVTAGGRVMGRVPQAQLDTARSLLENRQNRSRWMRHAMRRRMVK